MIEVKGLDKVQRRLEKMAQAAEDLGKGRNVSFAELFPNRFIQTHTSFQTMQEMIDAGGIDKPEDINSPDWSSFVATHSDFSNWDEMRRKAGLEYTSRALGF